MAVSFDDWRERFDGALERIERFRNDDTPDMRLITRWLMETEANPYGFIERSYARAFESAEDFAGLLHTIHHALVDDGEICFVAVNGRPMIAFANRDEIGYVELRSEVEVAIAERRGIETKYDFIDGVTAFIDRQDRYEAHRAAHIALGDLRRAKTITVDEWRAQAKELDADYERSIKPAP
jgi:hypothetical protein